MSRTLSIIVPVYNVELYLDRCINSIINQTYRDIEIILVDDGSTDNSGNICEEYAKKDNRIKVIHKQNGGLSSARNEGIKNATANLVAFVDSDDWITSDMYEHLIDLQTKYNADIVSCNYVLTSEYPCSIKNSKTNIKVMSREQALCNYMACGVYKKKNDYSAWKKLYKKELFGNTLFPEGLLFEDMATNFEIIQKCKTYVLSSKICYFYFQNSTSITRNQYSPRHNDLLTVSEKMVELSKKESIEIQKLAKIQMAKSYFSLLAKCAQYGHTKDLSEEFINQVVLHNFKQNYNTLLFSRISIFRKIIATCFYVSWDFSKRIMKRTNKMR